MRSRIRELEAEAAGNTDLAMVSISAISSGHAAVEMKQARQLDFRGEVYTHDKIIKTRCLTDTGASAEGFVDEKFVRRCKLHTMRLQRPFRLRLADDKFAPNVTHVARVNLGFKDHINELWCLVTSLGSFDIILGMPWLELHDPSPSFKHRSLTFNSEYCQRNCLLHHKSVTVHSNLGLKDAQKSPQADIAEISAYAFVRQSEGEQNQTVAMWPEDFEHLALPDDEITKPGFTADVAAISPEDYTKFYQKMNKVPTTMEETWATGAKTIP